jgi:Cu2+-exporting ATPase
MVEDFRFRFYVSIGVSIPILLLSPMIQDWLGIREALAFPGSIWVLFGLNAFVYVYGGWPFLKGMVDEIRKKTPGMMTLVALAISVAFFIAAPLCWAFLASYSSGKLRH